MKSLKILIVPLFTLLFCPYLSAQIKIDGTVKDIDNVPVSNALVELISTDDTTNIYSTNTNNDGYFSLSVLTKVEGEGKNISSHYLFLSNYPNPFNPSTKIYFELPKEDNIKITIYDILGKEIKTVFSGFHKSGVYELTWDGLNNWNQAVSAGVYFCRLNTTKNNIVHKMVLLDGGRKKYPSGIKKQNPKQKSNSEITEEYFSFLLKIKGENLLDTDLGYFTCYGDTTINLIVPRKLSVAAIGPAGGKLGNDDFLLEIPEGAFTETTELVLSLETDSIDFGDKTYTKLYCIDGLPKYFDAGLSLKIRTNDTPEDSVSIAIAELDTNSLLSDNFYDYEYFSAVYQDGFATIAIPPNLSNSNVGYLKKGNEFISSSYLKKFFVVINSPGIVLSSKKNFIFYYPNSHVDLIPYLDNYLESAIDTIVRLGFYKLPIRRNDIVSNWPVKVKFVDISNTFYYNLKIGVSSLSEGEYTKKKELKKHWYININKDYNNLFIGHNILQRSLGKDVFRNFLAQDDLLSAMPDNFWFLLSAALWSEKLFPYDINYINSHYDFENIDLLKYLEKFEFNYIKSILDLTALGNRKIDIVEKRVAFVPMVEYLTRISEEKDKIVYDIYDNVTNLEGADNPSVMALLNLTSENDSWLPDFYKEYFQGNIYPISSQEILKNVSENIVFSDGDTLKFIDDKFWIFNDLSARLFEVTINSNEIKNNGILNFKLGPENLDLEKAKALVFGISGNSNLLIGEGNDFLVGNLNQYDRLLACMVNSNYNIVLQGKTTIDMAIKTKITQIPFEGTVTLHAHFIQDLHIKDQIGNDVYDEWDAIGVDRVYNSWLGKVKLIDDSTYIGNWNEEDQLGYNHKGDIKLIIDPETKNLKYFEAEETQDGDQFTTITESITSKLINFEVTSEGYKKWNYIASDAETCNITNTFYYSSKNKYDDGGETMIQYNCNGDSYIMITFDYGQY